MMTINRTLLLSVLALLGGCATGNLPEALKNPPPGDVQPAAVLREPDTFRGAPVRWGGSVVSVRNHKDETTIEIVSRQLDDNGRPRKADYTEGRFLAKVAGFLDPAVFAAGREISVSGKIEGAAKQAIGDFPYTYAVVRVEDIYLWPPRLPPPSYPYYDPFWRDPLYPFGNPLWVPMRRW